MINKEQAVELVKAKIEKTKMEMQNKVKNFCEKVVSQEIESAATQGATSVEVTCDRGLASDIAEYLKVNGQFWVRIDAMNAHSSSLYIRWDV